MSLRATDGVGLSGHISARTTLFSDNRPRSEPRPTFSATAIWPRQQLLHRKGVRQIRQLRPVVADESKHILKSSCVVWLARSSHRDGGVEVRGTAVANPRGAKLLE